MTISYETAVQRELVGVIGAEMARVLKGHLRAHGDDPHSHSIAAASFLIALSIAGRAVCSCIPEAVWRTLCDEKRG